MDLDFDPALLLKMRSNQLNRLCPAGVLKCECDNDYGTWINGPFDFEKDPLGSILTYVGCNPGFCICKDKPDKLVDGRPFPAQAVMDICPKGEMNRCLCHDNKKVDFPFDIRTFFLDCRPKRVR